MRIINRLSFLVAAFLFCFAPGQAQGLPDAELKKLDTPGYFEPIKKVGDLPESIRKLYPPMASPGEKYSAGCVREDGLPGMALTFALKSKDRIWLSTVQGGIALVPEVVLYDISFKTPGLIWKASMPMSVQNKDDLKKVIAASKAKNSK